MSNCFSGNLSELAQSQLNQFKEYAISHPQLAQVDMLLMGAIREPAGFAHVLVYGPSGVGKTTMIRQITRRLNGTTIDQNGSYSWSESGYRNGNVSPMPLLLVETRPPDGGVFNRTDYYRTALRLLGEPFYEWRMMVDIDAEQTWEKKGRGRSKTAQFNDSPELRQALEEAMSKRGVKAVILDEAQHLMKIGSGASGGKLLDQLDWIKSMTNVTGVLHILIGTYELLNFRNLSGQASRRGLDIHFPRYLFQHEQERQDFQGILLALLKQVPLEIDIPALMQHWVYFYERSIGCVGVLKDWLIRAVAAALHDGCDTLTLERLHEHTLSLAQCERMAIEATEGEQKLCYMESRREHLWHLLQMGMTSTSVPGGIVDLSPLSKSTVAPVSNASATSKSTRKKRSDAETVQANTSTKKAIASSPEIKKRQTRKKKESPVVVTGTTQDTQIPVTEVAEAQTQPKKRQTRSFKQTPVAVTETTQDTQEMVQNTPSSVTETAFVQTQPKNTQKRKKKESAVVSEEMLQDTLSSKIEVISLTTESDNVEAVPKKNSRRGVGQRKPQRDQVGE
ncbi:MULTISPECIES: AAA family ATPase [Nostoc]|uniref:AAA family ATPase n=1 Tax=Nostoc paludosum FACHB-159 TaxID=2692908 RepID=A0ABR8K447_9NOSO|nr:MULTISPECIES: AAA family ATPase [Nostoc]MBD2677385.1 AAA family ATPase [Nostoc sp. FACHB-857]MBD2734222.1 AAA family ATPase [Nostoc paludosum FACHB-159]